MLSVIDIYQEDRWQEWLAGFSEKDIYYLPAYCRVCMEYGDGFPCAAFYEDTNGKVFYVFLQRDISGLPWLGNNSAWAGYSDIVTPYGYGGPLISCRDGRRTELLAAFREEFDRYCRGHKIVNEFIRFHPLLENHPDFTNLNVEFNRPTIAVDLHLGRDKIWHGMAKTYRNRIRKALKSGITVDFSNTSEDLREFIRLYRLTMDKNNADKYYYFDDQYFKNLRNLLKDHFVIANARIGGETIAAGIILCYESFMSYHLEGSDPEKLHLAPNNLLNFEIACYGIKQGVSLFHIGGGRGREDSLYKSKKALAPDGVREFWVGWKIHLEKEYRNLENLWKQNNGGRDINHGFFPVYRYSHPV